MWRKGEGKPSQGWNLGVSRRFSRGMAILPRSGAPYLRKTAR